MAPAPLHGKPRSFARGLFLTIISLGIYALYWHYKAFKEVYMQENRGQDFPLVLYVLAVIPIASLIGQILFMSEGLTFLNASRARYGLPPTFSLGGFLLWYVLGAFIIVGPFIAYYKLQTAMNGYWSACGAERPPQPAALEQHAPA